MEIEREIEREKGKEDNICVLDEILGKEEPEDMTE